MQRVSNLGYKHSSSLFCCPPGSFWSPWLLSHGLVEGKEYGPRAGGRKRSPWLKSHGLVEGFVAEHGLLGIRRSPGPVKIVEAGQKESRYFKGVWTTKKALRRIYPYTDTYTYTDTFVKRERRGEERRGGKGKGRE